MFKKYFWRLFSILILLATIAVGVIVKPEPALAISIDDYFTYSYTFNFYKADRQTPLDYVSPGETFYVRASGTATCIKDASIMGVSVTEANVVIQVVASLNGAEVVLNPSFTIDYKPFPKQGQTVTSTQDVPLIFPAGSPTGAYAVVGQVLQANVMIGGLYNYNAIGYLSQDQLEQSMGTVGYGVAVPVVGSGGGSGGGGGGGGGSGTMPEIPQPITKLTDVTGDDGALNTHVEAKTLDGMAVLDLPKGIKITDMYGHVATGIIMDEVPKAQQPKPPDGSVIIGKVYKFGGDDLTFSLPVWLTFYFDPTLLPSGVQKKDLQIEWWDDINNQWVALTDCNVDETANTVTATVNHFTIFTLIAKSSPVTTTTPTIATTPATTVSVSTTEPTTVPTQEPSATTTMPLSTSPSPAAFVLSDLTVTPDEIEVGENVLVSALVTNTGETEGEQEITLNLNNSPMETRQITLAGKTSQSLRFTVEASTVGTQTITLGDQSLQFTVKEASHTSPAIIAKKIYWWLIGILIGIGVALGIIIFILIYKKPWRKK